MRCPLLISVRAVSSVRSLVGGGLLLLATTAGDVRSEDFRPIGPWYASIWALAYEPSGGTVYAATDKYVYRSTDDGASWTLTSVVHSLPWWIAFGVSSADPDLVLAGTGYDGIYRSTDAGELWEPTIGAPSRANDLVGTPFFFFAASPEGVYRSVDSGSTFSPVGLFGIEVRAIAHQPLSGDLFATIANDGGVQRSVNGGDAWFPASAGIASVVEAIAAHPTSASILYTGGGFLYKTTNAGQSWQQMVSPSFPTFMDVSDIALDPIDGARVYFADRSEGVFRSTNGGGTWEQINSGLGDLEVRAMAAKPGASGMLLCGTANHATFGTTDGGSTWVERAKGFSDLTVRAIATHGGARFWVATDRGIILSTDGGEQWISSPSGREIRSANAIAPDPGDPNTVWAGARSSLADMDNIVRSSDGGFHWTTIYSTSGGGIEDVAVDESDPQWVYATSNWSSPELGRVIRTTNGGSSWSETSFVDVEHVYSVAIQPGTPSRLLVGTNHGLWESTDRGESYHPIALELGSFTIRDIAFSASTPNLVWVGTSSRGVYRSTDGGASFTPSSAGMGNVILEAIAVREVGSTRTLVVATSDVLFFSTDNGDSWVPMNDGLLLVGGIQTVTWEPIVDRLLVGTGFRGAFEMGFDTAAIPTEESASPGVLHLSMPRPNPFGGAGPMTIDLNLAHRLPIALGIYDAAGRCVVDFGIWAEPGPRQVQWDGRNSGGQHVASGTYFVRLSGSGHELVRKIQVVR